MFEPVSRAIAIVGVGAILPDAPNAATFWKNLCEARASISEVPSERWSLDHYYDPSPAVVDKTYSKLGGWVKGFVFDWKRFRVPPLVASSMDEGQQWALTASAEALADYGYPERALDRDRTGVILGVALGGDSHLNSHVRIAFPEYAEDLGRVDAFQSLPSPLRSEILEQWHERVGCRYPSITEDTMPGELPNLTAGRVANLLSLRGPNFTVDAACASSLAATSTAMKMLLGGHCDAVLTGGLDRNMHASSFVKFCKLGALSATGSRPFGQGADGFVMAEGAAVVLLKRLADAESAGDRIYAVIRGVGMSSDGRSKGPIAPSSDGQKLAIERAWTDAGLDPATATLIEAHGTSTPVGDVAEFESLCHVFGQAPRASIALGSAKGNIGHLKAGAGAVGLLKTALCLKHRMVPPTLNSSPANPALDVEQSPFRLTQRLQDWATPESGRRRAGVGAYGFGGTNFHLVLEEHLAAAAGCSGDSPPRGGASPAPPPGGGPPPGPGTGLGSLTAEATGSTSEPRDPSKRSTSREAETSAAAAGPTLEAGALVSPAEREPESRMVCVGAATPAHLLEKLRALERRVDAGWMPGSPLPVELLAPERLLIVFGDLAQLNLRLQKALRTAQTDDVRGWRALRSQGVFRGSGEPKGKVAFLFSGQGSQTLNMGRELLRVCPAVRETFDEADRRLQPVLGRPLTSTIFTDARDTGELEQAQRALTDTSIAQPAVLTLDTALFRLLAEHGLAPDMVMGHSLGEYAALVAARVMSFADALGAVATRGREIVRVSAGDRGAMAAVFAPRQSVEETLAAFSGRVVIANVNSRSQCVIGGPTADVQHACETFRQMGCRVQSFLVSHAFHTGIVAPAGPGLRRELDRLEFQPPGIPVVSNVTGGFYPADAAAARTLLERQLASPVEWVGGLEALYEAGVRTFVEVGPGRVLRSFTDDVFAQADDVLSLSTGFPRLGELEAFHHALCGLWAAGYGCSGLRRDGRIDAFSRPPFESCALAASEPTEAPAASARTSLPRQAAGAGSGSGALESAASVGRQEEPAQVPERLDRNARVFGSVVITGTGLGLPGAEKAIMDPENVSRLLRGEQLIDLAPQRFRRAILDKRVNRLVKGADGSARFEPLTDPRDVLKLAGRPGSFDLEQEYGVPADKVQALDITSQLAIAAGLDALREAGLPLVRHYRNTAHGRQVPDRWMLPEALQAETGVIFASVFPGLDRFASELRRYYTWKGRREQLEAMEALEALSSANPEVPLHDELARLTRQLREQLALEPYSFDRRFLFRVLPMGHSQLAEFVGARGPNAHVNLACASTGQALGLAEDWIRDGRCRRVLVVSGDAATSDELLEWIGAGFQALGAAATDDAVEEAALPFDRRRHGLILGMGASGFVVESEDAARERGTRGIAELLASETANSAYHATRLDPSHMSQVMDQLVSSAERRFGLRRRELAAATVLVSHEPYTPARGGSASAEIAALRHTFGDAAGRVVIANTKGFTGHPMGVGLESVAAVKMLEHSTVPPVPNLKEPDPELGPLNLSRGGHYPLQFALSVAAGFGSQLAMTFLRRIPGPLDRVDEPALYRRWLAEVSGHTRPELEVDRRVLRVRDQGPPAARPAASAWRPGTGPSALAAPGEWPTGSRMPAEVDSKTSFGQPVKSDEHRAAEALEPRPAAAGSSSALGPQPPAFLESPSRMSEPSPVAAGSVPGGEPIAAWVLGLLSKKTGYPEEMLELDLDMEADLGIDTVKQAETFAAIRERFGIPAQEGLRLRDYPTVGAVIEFVRGRAAGTSLNVPAPAAAPVTRGGEAPVENPAAQDGFEASPSAQLQTGAPMPVSGPRPPDAGDLVPTLDDAELVPRRVPVPVLRPALELCKPTGVALAQGSRVLVACDRGSTGKALARRLRDLGVTVLTLEPHLPSEQLPARVASWLQQGAIQGVYWLRCLDDEPELPRLDLAGWRALTRHRVKDLFSTMKALPGEVTSRGAFLVAATRMGGLHGYGPEPALAPVGGGVTGFCKAFKQERPDVLVKAVDFPAGRGASKVAERLLAETLADPAIVEVGTRDGLRFTVGLQERGVEDGNLGLRLGSDTVVLVTGATGGITSAIVADLAAAGAGIFYLLARTPLPCREEPDLALFATDPEALRRTLANRLVEAGGRATPVALDRRMLEVERRVSLLRMLDAIEAAGGTAHCRAVEPQDGPAVQAVLQEVRERHGRLDVLLHAAGCEVSHTLDVKEASEFERVFDVKADGLFNLLSSARETPPGVVVSFSSVAARFGNRGQVDYSAANDLLGKLTCAVGRWYPQTRGIAIDWTAWAELGMAARGSLPASMQAAGIELLSPSVGIPTVRRELTRGGGSGELVVGGSLGVLSAELDETGGLDVQAMSARLQEHPLPMLGKVLATRIHDGTVAELHLEPAAEPFLRDHELEEGLPILPGVIGVEAFAELATLLAPGYRVAAVRHVRFEAPVKFHRRQARTLRLRATLTPGPGSELLARAVLESPAPALEQGLPARYLRHFSAELVLSTARAEAPPADLARPAEFAPRIDADAIYRTFFHGPAYRVLARVTLCGDEAFGSLAQHLPPDLRDGRGDWLLEPRWLEACFQTAGVWELSRLQTLGLPRSIDSVQVHVPPAEARGTRLVAHAVARGGGDSFDVRVVDAEGRVHVSMEGYRTVAVARAHGSLPSEARSPAGTQLTTADRPEAQPKAVGLELGGSSSDGGPAGPAARSLRPHAETISREGRSLA